MSGMFGELEGLLGGGVSHQGVGNLLSDALSSGGGVQGLIGRADQAGLGDKVRSWVGGGGNAPVSAGEIAQIFPPAQIEQFAQAHGIPSAAVAPLLAHLLPHAVDQATPDGDAQAADQSAGIQSGASDPEAPAQPSAGGGFDFAGLAQRMLGGKM